MAVVESASCGCMNHDSRSKSRGRLSKIWPLFKNVPIDFAPISSRRFMRASTVQNSSRSFSPPLQRIINSRRMGSFYDNASTFDQSVDFKSSDPITIFSDPGRILVHDSEFSEPTTVTILPHINVRGSSNPNVSSTAHQSVKDYRPHGVGTAGVYPGIITASDNIASNGHASVEDSVGDMPSKRRLPSMKLRTTSPRTWNLYVAVEREFERLGISREKQVTASFKHHGEFPSIASETVGKIEFEQNTCTAGHLTNKIRRASSSSEGSPFNIAANVSFPNHDHGDLCDDIKEESMISEQINSDRFLHELVPDDLIGDPSISEFYSVVDKAGASLRKFCSSLIRAQRKIAGIHQSGTLLHGGAIKFPRKIDVVAKMLQPLMPDAMFESPHHFKFGLHACINQTIFRQFQTQSYGCRQYRHCSKYPNVKHRQLAFLKQYHAVNSVSVEQLMDAAASCEFRADFQQFCHKKLQLVQKRMGWTSRWPSKLSETFLESMKCVWIAHKLAFSFEKPATMFYVDTQAEIDRNYMNPIVDDPDHQRSTFYGIVQFTVFPGFALPDGILQSTVYLQPKLPAAITPSHHHPAT